MVLRFSVEISVLYDHKEDSWSKEAFTFRRVLCNFRMCECEVSDANCSFDNECRELGIAIVPYSPLGKGFFAGSKLTGAQEGDMRGVCNLSLAYSLGSYYNILLLLIRALLFTCPSCFWDPTVHNFWIDA
jgi:hypothetical protein